jgi:hypothetical protein
LSAIFFVVSLIARAQGWEQDVIERYAGSVEQTRPRKFKELTEEERAEREAQETRAMFAHTLGMVKATLARGDNKLRLY